MIIKALTSLMFVAGCAIALAVPETQAQLIDTQGQLRIAAPRPKAGDQIQWVANDDSMDNAQYERLLRADPAFRQSRMHKECGSLSNAHLRASCIDTFNIYEDQRSVDLNEGLTGGSTGMMNAAGVVLNGPHIYDNGAGQ